MSETDQAAAEWSPPKIAENGVAMQGDFPLNHRLRAEAMAVAGLGADPDGLIDPDMIADAAQRITAQHAAEAKADAKGSGVRRDPARKNLEA